MKKIHSRKKILHQMFIITHHLKKDFTNIISQYDLTEMEAKFLFRIGCGQLKVSDLVEYFKKHKSTITQKTRSLQKKGYIRIAASADDKRERVVSFTSQGEKFFQEVTLLEKDYHEKVFKGFSKKEEESLLQLLEKIRVTKNHENIC